MATRMDFFQYFIKSPECRQYFFVEKVHLPTTPAAYIQCTQEYYYHGSIEHYEPSSGFILLALYKVYNPKDRADSNGKGLILSLLAATFVIR